MKRFVVVLSIVLWTSFVCAQSHTTQFIDSPSWILAQEKGADAVELRQTVSSGKTNEISDKTVNKEAKNERDSERPQQAEATSLSGRSVAASKGGVAATPRKEGFLHVGIYLTPVVNWLSSVNKPYESSGVNACVTPTVMLDMRLFRRFYLGVGAAFNTFGGRVKYPKEGEWQHDRSYMFSYVEIPVRFKWQTRNFADSKGSLFLSAGLNLGFGVSYKYKDIYKGPFTTGLGSLDGVFKYNGKMKKDSRLVNLAAVAQVGYNYQIRPRVNLIIGVEYHYGFVRPVKKGKQIDGLGRPVYNNQQCGLVLGIMF